MLKTGIKDIKIDQKGVAKSFNDEEIREMIKVGLGWGLKPSRIHPKVRPYILGVKNNVSVFNLEKTKKSLDRALDFLVKSNKEGKVILFVGAVPAAREKVKELAEELSYPYVVERWVGGLITNFEEKKKRVSYLKELREKKEKDDFGDISTKEKNDLLRDLEKLEKNFSGIVNLQKLPEVIFLVDPPKHMTAVREAKKKDIPIVALANVDCDISLIDYPILGNSRARSSINYVLGKIKEALKK